MSHKHIVEAVDRTIRDLMRVKNPIYGEIPFGGIPTVFGGDFRQVLPVMPRATPQQNVAASVSRSELWANIRVHELRKNMRVERAVGDEATERREFAEELLKVGDGAVGDTYTIQDEMLVPSTDRKDLIESVFPNLHQNCHDRDWMIGRSVLCPTNAETENINNALLDAFPGDERVYLSKDKLCDDGHLHQYPVEFLNSLMPSGSAPHRLRLKIGAPVILLRNLDVKEGLCNGTRLIVRNFSNRVIDAEIAIGTHAGKRVFLPRVKIIPSDSDLPIKFS